MKDTRDEIIQLLHQELMRAQATNPRYSIRGFAKRLRITPSALSEFLSAKRRLTLHQSERILDALLVSPGERERLLTGVVHASLRRRSIQWLKKRPATSDSFTQLDHDTYQAVSEWYYYAILSLLETEDFEDDPAWIAGRLQLTTRDTRVALERLERLGLVVRDARTSRLKVTGAQFKTSSDILDLGIRKGHFQSLEIAKRSLETDPIEDRDFSSMTMAVDPKLLPKAKSMIRNFRYAFCDFMESGAKREVYQLNLQLIPLSKRKPEMKPRARGKKS